MAFSFSFAGDDIEEDHQAAPPPQTQPVSSEAGPSSSAAGAFPVQGKPMLPPTQHELESLLSRLPSKIAFSLLSVDLGHQLDAHIPQLAPGQLERDRKSVV